MVERLRARDAAVAVRRLTGRGIDVSVVPREDEQRPVAAHPDRWCRRSYRWGTAFPAIHERRGPLDLAEVARWCSDPGLPDPSFVRRVLAGAGSGGPADRRMPSSWASVLDDYDVQIRVLRRVRGLSWTQLATLVSAARKAVVYQWEARKRTPSPLFWQRIAALYR